MPGRSLRIRSTAVAAALVAAASLAACSGSGDGGGGSTTPSASDFPQVEGRTIEQVFAAQPEAEYVVSPAGLTFEPGKNRYAFGVFELDGTPVDDAEVALYFSKSPTSPVEGPLPATVRSLETKPAYRAQGAGAPGEPRSYYVVDDVRFDRAGPWLGIAVVNADDGPQATRLPSPVVGKFPLVATVGQKAPAVSTPTGDSVGGDLSKIDTRLPPSTMHGADFRDVLGKKPVVLVFATPAFCQSRVCGPVVDAAEQVKDEVGDGVEFIHMEIYEDNDPGKGFRPQVEAFGLPTEPWVFLVGSDGRIEERLEGAFGVEELSRAVERLKKSEAA
jgi:hypothetical protein